ncbi:MULTISPECIES: HEAT repeat domain-containing protein [unclassified Streptomyces]|uniref:HEAT repeat domain-containing protein n=1 Tax=unclassified Streptomyces TaxID=2593676 RepID=UPI002E2C1734|nr:HEAT repeat domain-containing protein [Streptomyces sp. NBC_01601]
MPGAEDHLVGAVRAGRAHRVRELLWAGADPETADAEGTPVLCLAVGAFDGHVAEALLDAGADPLRPLPDGTTPLLRAVASGNAGLTGAMLVRALACADGTHADWSETTAVLGERLDDETWEAALSLRSDPDPLCRLFAADLVWHVVLNDNPPRTEEYLFERRALDVLLPWAVGETDPAVLASVLNGLSELDDPRIEEVVLAHRTHPDPRVRRKVPGALRRTRHAFTHPDAWEVLATLARDPDAFVRATVCEHLYAFEGRCRAAADILAGFLEEDDQLVRIKAVSGLADADDPRCVEGARLIGPVDRAEWPDTWLLDAVRRYEHRHGG